MKQGMLWYDNFIGKDLNARIRNAVVYFTQKYGCPPKQCFVHPEMISGKKLGDFPFKITADEKVLRNHIWIEFPRAE